MRRLRTFGRGGRVLLALAVGGTLFGIATAVQADIPDSGTINACFYSPGKLALANMRKGDLRVIDTSKGQSCAPDETALSWGATGPTGPAGPTNVVTRVNTETEPAVGFAYFGSLKVNCHTGERALGGGLLIGHPGAGPSSTAEVHIVSSGPLLSTGNLPADGDTPTGWFVGYEVTNGSSSWTFTAYVTCAS